MDDYSIDGTRDVLKEMEAEKVSQGFTAKVMAKLNEKLSVKPAKSKFFIGVIIVFLLGIIAIFTITLLNAPPGNQNDNVTVSIVNVFRDILTDTGEIIASLFSSGNFLIVGLFLTFILLLSGFFMLNSHKSFLNKLQNY